MKKKERGNQEKKKLILWTLFFIVYLIGGVLLTLNAYIQAGTDCAKPYASGTALGILFWCIYMELSIVCKSEKKKTNRGETDIFFTVLMSVLCFAGLVGLGFICKQAGDKLDEVGEQHTAIHTEIIPLQSINAGTRVSGTSFNYFTYGVGQINEKDYYVAYRILEDGGKQLYKMPAGSTVIYETLKSDAQAYVEEDVNGYGSVRARRLYVPENSIEQKYDLSFTQ